MQYISIKYLLFIAYTSQFILSQGYREFPWLSIIL